MPSDTVAFTPASWTTAFSAALFAQPEDGPAQSPLAHSLGAHAGFAVYRNTVYKGYVDALAANYPTVLRMVGPAWFAAAAQHYALTNPDNDPRLLMYGAGFDAFLADFPPAQDLTYLPFMATLDRAWTLAHCAADAPLLTVEGLQAVALASTSPDQDNPALLPRVRPHPAARWYHHATLPIATLWQRTRAQSGEADALDWVGESLWLSRVDQQVVWTAPGTTNGLAGCAFLDACQQGCDLATACEQALAHHSTLDLGQLLLQLVAAGMLQAP